jgi:hypothetical protein
MLSLGSNKALEYLSGGTVDFGSMARIRSSSRRHRSADPGTFGEGVLQRSIAA